MPKVVAQYAPTMSEERRQRIIAAIKESSANLGKSIGWSDVDWSANENDTETKLTIHFANIEPQKHKQDRDRADRLAAELRCCGMVASVVEYGEGQRRGDE